MKQPASSFDSNYTAQLKIELIPLNQTTYRNQKLNLGLFDSAQTTHSKIKLNALTLYLTQTV